MTTTGGRLAGKVALITGCSPFINGGIACGLAEAGARVVCVDLREDFVQACAREIRDKGGEALGVTCDVTRDDQVRAAIAKGEAAFGPLDILVNGAMLQIRKGVLDMEADEFRKLLDVGVIGTFLFTKHAAHSMIRNRRRGSMINIISTEGHQGNLGNIGYGTAKSGLLNFTRAAAMELAEHGIRVNSLTPTATDATEGKARAAAWGVPWEQVKLSIQRSDLTSGDQGVPLGRRPSPSDYAHAAVFLASEDAAMITGVDLRVDGGVIARYWRWNPGTNIQPAG